MKITELMKSKIKEWEGCRLVAYRCPAGLWTIGYGHTGSDVMEGKRITQNEADALFDKDVGVFERWMTLLIEHNHVTLSQCQFDAVVSFCYNVGCGKFERSTLWKKIKACAGDLSISDEFRKWNKGGGRVLPGLVKRREWEVKRYWGSV